MQVVLALTLVVAGIEAPAVASGTPRAAKLGAVMNLGAPAGAGLRWRAGGRACANEEPKHRGVGLMVAGGLVAGLGGLPAIVVGGIASSGACFSVGGSCEESESAGGGGLLVFGVMMLAVGATLLGIGGHRHQRWLEWKSRQGMRAPWGRGISVAVQGAGASLRF